MRLAFATVSSLLFLSCINTLTADEISNPVESAGTVQSFEPIETTESAVYGVTQEGCNSCGGVPGCSVCNGGSVCGGACDMCAPPACGVCGTARCWDCSHEEGIDIDSLTVAAQSKALYEASRARIIVICQEDTGVSLMDQKMSTLGAKRSFTVDVNDRDRVYKYEIKVDVVRGGKKYFKKHKISDLRAGMILTVTVDAPPAEEGVPAQLGLEVVPDAPGGKPVDEGDDGKEKPTTDVVKKTTLVFPAIH